MFCFDQLHIKMWCTLIYGKLDYYSDFFHHKMCQQWVVTPSPLHGLMTKTLSKINNHSCSYMIFSFFIKLWRPLKHYGAVTAFHDTVPSSKVRRCSIQHAFHKALAEAGWDLNNADPDPLTKSWQTVRAEEKQAQPWWKNNSNEVSGNACSSAPTGTGDTSLVASEIKK